MSRPFIPAPNCVSVEMIYSCYSQVIENVFHVVGSAPFSASDIVTLRGVFNAWDNGTGNLRRCQNVLLTRIRTKALDSQGAPYEDYALSPARPGQVTQNAATLSVTKALKCNTGLTGRSYRGRIYLIGIPPSVMGNQMWDVSDANNWIASYTTLKNNINAANSAWKLCVLSYRTNKAWRASGVPTPITTFSTVNYALDCQRRRLTGRGRS